MTDLVQVTDEDGIRIVRINRADKKNALTQDMYLTMAEALESAGEDDVACVVVFGLPGIFSAGNDIKDFMAAATSSSMARSSTMQFLQSLATCKKPLIAGVDGLAVGVGTTMLFHCDMVFASPQAAMKTPFLSLGLVPEAASSLIAPRVIGSHRAFELLIMGETFSAERAHQAGFVNHIVDSELLEEKVLEAAKKLAALPPESLRLSRELLKGKPDEILQRINEEVTLFTKRLQSAEAQEAFAAFMEKRPPDFKKLT